MSVRTKVNSCFSRQVDFVKAVVIVRVATQGRQDYRQWVTQYYLRYALDGIHFVDYKQKNTRKVRIKQKSFFYMECYAKVSLQRILFRVFSLPIDIRHITNTQNMYIMRFKTYFRRLGENV